MYNNLSNDFLEKMMLPSQIKRLTGTIDNVEISSKNILQETTKISNQCSDNNDILIGQVYIGQLNITLRGLNIPRGSYKGKEIVLYEGLEIDHELGTFEDVLLGHFFIDKPEWTFNGVECVCYDAMHKFDKSMSLSMTQGKIYDFVSLACQRCHVTLGMTQQQIEALPNGNITLKVYKENDMSNYRDLISWCAQTTATNATINREGLLVFKAYNINSVYTFSARDRLGINSKYADFSSFYTGISMVNIDQQMTKYYGLDPDNGSVMNLGSNPLLQPYEGETEQELEVKRRRILNAIAIINYTPFKTKIHRPLVFDLMDVIQIAGGLIGNETVTSCITKYDWTFMGGYNINCSGSDPALASAKSKTDKNLSGLMSSNAEIKETVNETTQTVSEVQQTVSGVEQTVTQVQQTVTQVQQEIEDKITFALQPPSGTGKDGEIVIVTSGPPGNSGVGMRIFTYEAGNNGNNGNWVEYPLIAYGKDDIGVGANLPTGKIYFVYEE